MKDFIFTIICAIVLLACGCAKISHSANVTATGKIFKVGGEAYNLLYVNGLLNMNTVRENAESIVETTDDDGFTGGPTSEAKGVKTIRFRTGPIISGYMCDLAKTCPEAATEYVKSFPEMNKPFWDTKQTMPEKKEGEKSTSQDYIDYLKEKLKSIVGKDSSSKSTITGDGEYKELYKDNSISAQAALTAELLAIADDEAKMEGTSETYRDTLVHYTGRLAQLKAKGKTETNTVLLDRCTVRDGRLTYLMYRACDPKGEWHDEECPSCYSLDD